jgi:hypothetical protein
MEPRKEQLKKTQEQHKQERKRCFQIVKLEERIAPRQCSRYNPKGKCIGGH